MARAALAIAVALEVQYVLAVGHAGGSGQRALQRAVGVSGQLADGVAGGGVLLADEGDGDLLVGGEAGALDLEGLGAVLIGDDPVGALYVGVVEGDDLLGLLVLLLTVDEAGCADGPAVGRAIGLGLDTGRLDQLGNVQGGGPAAILTGGGLHDGGHGAVGSEEGDANSRVRAGATGSGHREGGV